MRLAALLLLVSAMSFSCRGWFDHSNQLTEKEKQEGWSLLFDGRTTRGWHLYHEGNIPSAWIVKDGALYCDPNSKAKHGDLVSDGEYENFELAFDWKISPGGNSGVFINVIERPDIPYTWSSGPEYQLLDVAHPDYPVVSKRSGCLFGYGPTLNPAENKPTGEWNHSSIRQQNGKIAFYLNGVLTFQQDLHSQAWRDWVAQSSFKSFPEFGAHTRGHIGLQEWSRGISFRNIKIRVL